jgi:hypothetical protein
MADGYVPGNVPDEYDVRFLQDELRRISAALQQPNVAQLILHPQAVEPTKVYEGLVVNANGTDWNPGSGAGLYQYLSGAWVKL